MHGKISTHVDEGREEGIACTELGSRTPIGVSGNLFVFCLPKYEGQATNCLLFLVTHVGLQISEPVDIGYYVLPAMLRAARAPKLQKAIKLNGNLYVSDDL